VVEIIGQYSWYLSIALLLGIFVNLWRQSRARRARTAAAATDDGGEGRA
jgi:hypothetical protein